MERMAIIGAIGKNRELGRGGKLLWHLPDDLRRFKALTVGHPVIMGRKTWESLPRMYRPLPGRTNIVITRQNGYQAPGAEVVASFEAARSRAERAAGADEIFVIGGGEIYAAALPFADRLYLTLVDAEADADTFFPFYENDFKVVAENSGSGEPRHRFLIFERK